MIKSLQFCVHDLQSAYKWTSNYWFTNCNQAIKQI